MRNCIKVNIHKSTTNSDVVFDVHAFVNDNQAYTTVYCSTYQYAYGDTVIEFDAPLMFNDTLAQQATKQIANRLNDIRSKTDYKTYTVSAEEFPNALNIIHDILEEYQLREPISYQHLDEYIDTKLKETRAIMPKLVDYVNSTGDLFLDDSPLNNFFSRYAVYQWLVIGGNLTKIVYDDNNTYVVGRMLDKIPVDWCTMNVVQCTKDIVNNNTVHEADSITERELLSHGHMHKIAMPSLFTVQPYKYYT